MPAKQKATTSTHSTQPAPAGEGNVAAVVLTLPAAPVAPTAAPAPAIHKKRRQPVPTNDFDLLRHAAAALDLTVAGLALPALNNADGNPTEAARIIYNHMQGQDVVLYNQRMGGELPEHFVLDWLASNLTSRINDAWRQIFRSGAAKDLADAAAQTGRLSPATRWRLITDFDRATEALSYAPGNPELLRAQGKARAAAVAACLTVLHDHYREFLTDPDKEPTYPGAGRQPYIIDTTPWR